MQDGNDTSWMVRCLWRCALSVGVAVSLTSTALGQTTLHRFANPQAWVEIAALPPTAADAVDARKGNESSAIVLFDRQVNVTATGDEYYQHLAARVLSTEGVAEYSQIDIVVDPTFQTLDVHWLRIVRDGVVIDQRTSARIAELAQESDLRNRIYNGRHTVNVVLSDVRAGDVVEYAFTLRSRERLFPGHYYSRLDVGWSVRIAWQRIRVRAPSERRLLFRASDGMRLPEPVARDGAREFVFETRDSAAIPAESGVPGWHSPWPYLEVGDLESWNEVVERVTPLYRRDGIDVSVRDVAERIRVAGGTPEQHLMRALQFVQTEVRYTSISIGRGSHEPSQPAVVLERRYGDCKDKSLLLSEVLDVLGIEAAPALVHTRRGRGLDQALPTPYAFDHVIVRAVVNGNVYWLDPTRMTQHGELSADQSVDYERALVVGNGVQELARMPPLASSARAKNVVVTVDLRKGIEAPATLTVWTRYRGDLAGEMRSSLSTRSPEQMQTDYTAYTSRYYPTARFLEPLSHKDDRDANVIDIQERYGLDKGFQANSRGILELSLHADELYSHAEALGAAGRRAPLVLEHPLRVRQTVVAHLPEPWPVTPRVVEVENAAFHYRGEVDHRENTVILSYEYESRADHVPAAEIARFETDRARMNDDLGYMLTFDPTLAAGSSASVVPLPLLLVLLTLLGSGWLALRFGFRHDPMPAAVEAGAPVGIRGWLVLPAIAVIVSPLALISTWFPFVGSALWSELPTLVDESFRGSARVVAAVAMCGFTALGVLYVLLACLFFTRRTSAPGLYIASGWLSWLLLGVFSLWSTGSGLDRETELAAAFRDVIREASVMAIWTLYMRKSRRVRATFVRRWQPGDAQPRPSEVAVEATVPPPVPWQNGPR